MVGCGSRCGISNDDGLNPRDSGLVSLNWRVTGQAVEDFMDSRIVGIELRDFGYGSGLGKHHEPIDIGQEIAERMARTTGQSVDANLLLNLVANNNYFEPADHINTLGIVYQRELWEKPQGPSKKQTYSEAFVGATLVHLLPMAEFERVVTGTASIESVLSGYCSLNKDDPLGIYIQLLDDTDPTQNIRLPERDVRFRYDLWQNLNKLGVKNIQDMGGLASTEHELELFAKLGITVEEPAYLRDTSVTPSPQQNNGRMYRSAENSKALEYLRIKV